MNNGHRLALVGGLAVLAAFPRAACAQTAITPFSQAAPGTTPPPGWSALTFPAIERHTRYRLVADAGTLVVAATADASASGWVHRVDVPATDARVLRWRWKGERLPANADTRTTLGDDAIARIYVMFRQPPDRVSLPQRMVDEATRALYGEVPPHSSLMYVWDTHAPAGTRNVNPYTGRVRNVVVESGPARLGRWLAYERDLVADYRAAYDEDPPAVFAIAIMTDADNTGGSASARYGDVTLSPR